MRTFLKTVVHVAAVVCACFTMCTAGTTRSPSISNAFLQFDDLANCGNTLGCMRTPEGCEPQNCDVLATWKQYASDPSKYIFEIGGKNPNLDDIGISFCLSRDAAVGSDSCMTCRYVAGFAVTVLNYITATDSTQTISDSAITGQFTSLDGQFSNMFVYCRALHPITFNPGDSRVFDLRTSTGEWLSYNFMISTQRIVDTTDYQQPSKRIIWPNAIPVNKPMQINGGSEHMTVFGILPLLVVILHLL